MPNLTQPTPGLALHRPDACGPGRAQADAFPASTQAPTLTFDQFQSTRTHVASMFSITGEVVDVAHAGTTYAGGMWLIESEEKFWMRFADGDWDYTDTLADSEAMLYQFALDTGKVVKP